MAVFAPTPRATVKIAMAVKPGFLASPRKAYLRSWSMVFIGVWGSGATGVPFRRYCGDWLSVDAAGLRCSFSGRRVAETNRCLGVGDWGLDSSPEPPVPRIKNLYIIAQNLLPESRVPNIRSSCNETAIS